MQTYRIWKITLLMLAATVIASFCSINAAALDDAGENETAEITDAGTSLSHKSIDSGEIFTIISDFTGGDGDYDYSYGYICLQNGKEYSTSYIKNQKYSFKMPKTAANYNFYVKVKDQSGKQSMFRGKGDVEQATGKELAIKASVDADKTYIGQSISVTANPSGGTAPYKFRYSYRNEKGEQFYIGDSFVYNQVQSIKLPEKAGKYTVFVSVKDNRGKTAWCSSTVNSYPLSVADSKVSKTTAAVKEKVVLTAVAKFSSGKTKFHYSFHEQGKQWTYEGGYTSSNKHEFSFAKSGVYYIRAAAKDERGTYTEKQFRLTVVELDVSASSVSKTLIKTGEKVRLSTSAKNINGQLKCHYSYHRQGKTWSFTGEYTTKKYMDFSFADNGIYYIRVGAKDGSGLYKEKQFCIYVYNAASRKTIRNTQLMSSAKWAGTVRTNVPSGSYVNVINTYGHWFMVKYKDNTGWLYNLALGNYKNYSTISASTIGSYCDDLIFSKGRSIKALFGCVSSSPYKATNDLGYENNIVYIIKYKRGACYQHTNYLDYLLKRAGYETKMVNDGKIKRSPSWIKHTWVIVKTSDGWRHIDATNVRETGCAYLKTDSYLSKYFYWDTSKYPKCV